MKKLVSFWGMIILAIETITHSSVEEEYFPPEIDTDSLESSLYKNKLIIPKLDKSISRISSITLYLRNCPYKIPYGFEEETGKTYLKIGAEEKKIIDSVYQMKAFLKQDDYKERVLSNEMGIEEIIDNEAWDEIIYKRDYLGLIDYLKAYAHEPIKKDIRNYSELCKTIEVINGSQERINKLVWDTVVINPRLVTCIAMKFTGRGLPLIDLIQEGNIGLFEGAKRYDPERGYHFSTYVVWWIKQGIQRAICDYSRTIRVTVKMNEQIGKMNRVSGSLFQDSGKEPTEEEIAKKMNLKVTEIKKIIKAAQKTLSLENQVGYDEDDTLGSRIEDKTVPSPYITVENKALSEKIGEALKKLTEKEAIVLTRRFGLEDGNDRPLQQIGDEMGLSKERIRQIEENALRKLKEPHRSEKLRTFY